MSFANFNLLGSLADIVDILLVWYVIYKLINVIRGTRAVQLLKGIFVIVIVKIISDSVGFNTLSWMMEQALTWGFLAIIIIFQPELRRALEQLGRGRFFSRSGVQEEEDQDNIIEAIVKATDYMAKRRIGALISIERETGMSDYIETGIQLNSKISSELLINTFIPNTPLHDGAVIIQKNVIAAAACYLPLSESPFISKELGTRHRAALGISEVTDSITVIISEETGNISLTKNGELHRDLALEVFTEILTNELQNKNKQKQTSSARWNWRGKKNG
jgi:diadenylate cyclase